MSRFERITHLDVQTLTIAGVPYEAPAEAEPADDFVPPIAPLPLPEKLTMAALGQAYQDLVDTLVTAGCLSPRPDAEEAAE